MPSGGGAGGVRLNAMAGHLLRTKFAGVDEGGVAPGFAPGVAPRAATQRQPAPRKRSAQPAILALEPSSLPSSPFCTLLVTFSRIRFFHE